MDWTRPTGQMLGRFQPWHEGHLSLFKRIHEDSGQVIVQIRHVEIDDNNPYDTNQVATFISTSLNLNGFTAGIDYDIMIVPNIVNIGYGRDVGYKITQYDLGEDIHNISATKIRLQGLDE